MAGVEEEIYCIDDKNAFCSPNWNGLCVVTGVNIVYEGVEGIALEINQDNKYYCLVD